jgi:hypothetical protein
MVRVSGFSQHAKEACKVFRLQHAQGEGEAFRLQHVEEEKGECATGYNMLMKESEGSLLQYAQREVWLLGLWLFSFDCTVYCTESFAYYFLTSTNLFFLHQMQT